MLIYFPPAEQYLSNPPPAQLNISGVYHLESHDSQYRDYLLAMDIPTHAVNHILTAYVFLLLLLLLHLAPKLLKYSSWDSFLVKGNYYLHYATNIFLRLQGLMIDNGYGGWGDSRGYWALFRFELLACYHQNLGIFFVFGFL